MAIKLAEQWQEMNSPIVNGIHFPSGRILQMEEPEGHLFDTGKSVLRPVAETSLAVLEKSGQLDWTACTMLDEDTNPVRKIRGCCGEGGWGGDGFVAVSNAETRDLLWLAFFDFSNPFCEIHITADSVYATSTLDVCWIFPISDPSTITRKGLR